MSHDHNALDPGLTGIEDALGSLAPAPSRLDRDRLMFHAGQVATRSSPFGPQRLWVAIAACFGLIAVGEAAFLARRPAPHVIERVVVVREPVPPPVDASPERPTVRAPSPSLSPLRPFDESPTFGQTPYDRLTSQVFRYGLDGLPAAPSARVKGNDFLPATTRQLLREELQRILEPGDPS